jgi:oligopeptide transport system substrate-binding protein
MKKINKVLALLLSLVLVVSATAGCSKDKNTDPKPTDAPAVTGDVSNNNNQVTNEPANNVTDAPEPTSAVVQFEGDYIFHDSVSTLATNWNPHTYQTTDDAYPIDTGEIVSTLYRLDFNDANHPIEGKDPFTGYVILPEMAAADPIDVTEKIKAEHPEFNIPESATSGYAWAVPLRTDLCFDDGTKITPETFVESLKRVLDPKLLNYRAADVYDGTYAICNAKNYALAGNGAFKSFADAGTTYADFIAAGHTDDEVVIDINGFWGISTETGKNYVSITDETLIRDPAVAEGEDEDYVSGKYLWDTYLCDTGAYAAYQPAYVGMEVFEYEAGFPFEKVGLFKSGDNEITYVFNNAMDGFYLKIYALSCNWLVEPTLYDSCLKETTTASGSVWSSTYNTGVATSRSYGPYKVSDYQLDKSIHFVKNDKWFGWTDGTHVYVDPEDGETYPMYQTTEIDCQVVAEATTRKQMFFAGELMGYGLQAEDFDQYRNSEYVHSTPAETVYFAIFNGYESVINDRENAADFDKNTVDLQSMTLNSFRRAVAVTFDKDLFCATVSPARVAAFGLIGNTYIYDPETCAYYRDTPQAMQALCDFYSVDTSKYASLKDAVASITGYDPETAKTLYQQAYTEALEKGYITDADGDGKSDQTVTITYSLSADSDFQTKMINYLNEKIGEAAAGTGFEGKIAIVKSAPCGNDWSNNIRNGIYDMVLGGWSGSAMDPFGLTELYVDPDRAYDGKWFDGTKVDMTVNIDGKDLTMTLKEWSDALNGMMVTHDGVDYNFGYGVADVETRLNILAKFEGMILGSYDYIPMMNNGSMSLLSQQVYYVVEEYNPVLSRGGIRYMKYNYDETEWKDYVKSQGGTLKY